MTIRKNGVLFTLIALIYLLPDLVANSLNIIPFELRTPFNLEWLLLGMSDFLTIVVFATLTLLAVGDDRSSYVMAFVKMMVLGICFIMIKFFFGVDESYSLISVIVGVSIGLIGFHLGHFDMYSHMAQYGLAILLMILVILPFTFTMKVLFIQHELVEVYQSFSSEDYLWSQLDSDQRQAILLYEDTNRHLEGHTILNNYINGEPLSKMSLTGNLLEAWGVERSSNEVMKHDLMLNALNFDKDITGVQYASKVYYNKNFVDLNVKQILGLMVMAENPSSYHLIVNNDRNMEKVSEILQ